MYQLLASGGVWAKFLQVVPIALAVGLMYAVLRCIYVKGHQVSTRWGVEIARGLFVCYLTGLVNLTLVPGNFWSHIWANIFVGYSGIEIKLFNGGFNFIPSVIKVLRGELVLGSWVKTMLVGNLFMFMPMGFFFPFVTDRANARNTLKLALIVPVAIEIVQPVVGRSFDIDDIIMNFMGIMIGYLIAVGIRRLASKTRSK